ncbi:MAG: M48 family metallopeptidase [Kiritimatiellae bacterium]|nr:M48 family metallopeptidase [Kiritimatiellia bacterium]MDW8459029.1 M48 family metallopeptidase [Verrucomicrobiota bacterium]
MFEVIRANRRKSVALVLSLGALLAVLGWTFGVLVHPSTGPTGVVLALGVWLLLLAVSFVGGEAMLMAQAGGREIQKKDAPQLFNVVEEMTIASGLGTPPKIYLIDTPIPNAFAVGRNERRAAVGFTTGLLAKLNRDELQGVAAHEIAHIKNRDTLFMTIAGTTVGAIILLCDMFARGLRFTATGRRRSSRDGGVAVIVLLAVILSIVAPLLAQLLYFATSRRREYLADACAAQYTRYPEGLASALEKIAGGQRADAEVSRVLAPMYIVSPFRARGHANSLFSTHPPTEDRIHVLRSMGQSASLRAYEEAYKRLHGGTGVMGSFALASVADAPVREPTAGEAANAAEGWRSVRNILRSAEGGTPLDCDCGLRLWIPPAWTGAPIRCPRCGHHHRMG